MQLQSLFSYQHQHSSLLILFQPLCKELAVFQASFYEKERYFTYSGFNNTGWDPGTRELMLACCFTAHQTARSRT